MATKTVTMEIDAYERMVRARRDPKESFSNVLRRAVWLDAPATGAAILESLEAMTAADPRILLHPEALDAMEQRTRSTRERSAWDGQA